MMRSVDEVLEELVQVLLSSAELEVCAYNDAGNIMEDVGDLRVRLDVHINGWVCARSLSLKEQLSAYSKENKNEELLRAMKRLRAVGLHALTLAKEHEEIAKEVGLM